MSLSRYRRQPPGVLTEGSKRLLSHRRSDTLLTCSRSAASCKETNRSWLAIRLAVSMHVDPEANDCYIHHSVNTFKVKFEEI
jgi:hypothetical protein